MIEAALGIVLVVVGLSIVFRLWKSQRRLLARTASAPDRSVFSAMDLAPSAPHHFQARTSKPADTFRSLGDDLESEKYSPVLAPTGIHAAPHFKEGSPRLLDDLDRSGPFPRLPLGADEPDDPKQDNLGF